MPKFTLFAIVFIFTSLITTGASGQNVYKCGSSYSQKPCDGGVVLDVSDPRSAEQKKAHDADVVRQTQAANLSQAQRRVTEAEQQRANSTAINLGPKPKVEGTPHETTPKRKRRKSMDVEVSKPLKPHKDFTATVPGTGKSKKKKSSSSSSN